jgi:Gon7 family
MAAENNNKSVSATYTAPSAEEKVFGHQLPTISPDISTNDRVAYLAALRQKTTELQSQINTFLTQKMEEDKTRAGASAAADDEHEEDNYGEEVVDDAT